MDWEVSRLACFKVSPLLLVSFHMSNRKKKKAVTLLAYVPTYLDLLIKH